MSTHSEEIDKGKRFEFGKNWESYLLKVTDSKIAESVESLKELLNIDTLSNKTFLDIGSGSGLFSLSAKKLGASVTSFDFDPKSVECTLYIKEKYYKNDPDWKICEGSILDEKFVANLECSDIVYSWGVLHHTGNMHLALDNAAKLVKQDGTLFIAIYNDQGIISKYWKFVKKNYNKNKFNKFFITIIHTPYLFGVAYILNLTGLLKKERGMVIWNDMVDWLGGYPFECATPEYITDYFFKKGFSLEKIKSRGIKMGCNEFVFKKM